MRDYVLPLIGHMGVDRVTTADVLRVLDPIWNTKRDAAIKVVSRIGAIVDTAIIQKHRGDNPVNLKLKHTLQKERPVAPTHLGALTHDEVAAAIETIRATDAYPTTKLAFEFLILTAAALLPRGEMGDPGEGSFRVVAEPGREHMLELAGRP